MAPFLFGRSFFERHAELVADIVRGMGPDAGARALMAAQAWAARSFPGEALARQVSCPVLCMAGLEDTLTPREDVRASADLLPRGRYLEIPDAGHSLLLESPRVFEAALSFAVEGAMPPT